ncbi:prepilin-type N-terminal cleavage/methylation domain-containing protein [Candidatus Gracilibacteria bacterium]|nr:prepilin-type N-terminal cleavage/methylation domain-containing protein [Candidatus Gracilibacteria bacterium]MCF7819488.1 prepilin-type N-terminal cleavage/methylation domain-containing protein [Candidatus Gracilibacteria bacterium]
MNSSKSLGFTLIEVLVVIIIIGILATISTATLKNYFVKARDAARKATVNNITLIVKVDASDQWSNEKYIYNVFGLRQLFEKNDYRVPKASNNYCYLLGMGKGTQVVGDDNQFFVLVWGEESNLELFNKPGPIVDGTQEVRLGLWTLFEAGDIVRENFVCENGIVDTSSFQVLRSFANPLLGQDPVYFGIDANGEIQNSAPGQ